MSALIPIEQKEIIFNEDTITAVLIEDEQGVQQVYVPLRPIIDNLGLDWAGQFQRINRDAVLPNKILSIVVTTTRNNLDAKREMTCLHLDYLGGFLFGINANRVKAEVQEALVSYQENCYQVIRDAFVSGQLTADIGLDELIKANPDSLAVQAYQMAQAIVKLAQQQIVLEAAIDQHTGILTDHAQRLEVIEASLGDEGRHITTEQASNITQSIRLIAQHLSTVHGGNQYGATYGEFYRKFGISAYRELPAAKYDEAMAWLREWWQNISNDSMPF